jgi:pilus assembly protein CpaC
MFRLHITRSFLISILILIFILMVPVWNTAEAQQTDSGITVSKKFQLMVGKSLILKSDKPIKRISEPDTKMVTAMVISAYEVYVYAKAAGTTNLIIWTKKKDSVSYDIEVTNDVTTLKEKLFSVLPEEKEIHVIPTHDSITLTGRVSNVTKLERALTIARAYTAKGKLNNLLEVGGVQQVMLEVRVAEMSRSTTKKLGINFSYGRGGEFGLTTLGGLSQLVSNDPHYAVGPLGILTSSALNAYFRFNSGSATWTGLIDALKEDGMVKILAEPTLIAISGDKANFLAGGEFPVPVPQGDGDITIEYKKYGVSLAFTPLVLGDGKISIDVTPEVSEPDYTTAVQFSGFVIPGITARRASTRIELADGQSFAIAGLLSERVRESVSKFPLLGDIPILGALFRSTSFVKNETELIIIVTPHLVKPFDAEKQVLPTDFYIEPNDAEFYLFGLLEGRRRAGKPELKGKLEGQFGHTLQ